MTREENIRTILECNFAGFKDDIIDVAVKRICELEQDDDTISRQAMLKTYEGLKDDDLIAVWLIRKNIEQQKTVNPQEPICEEREKGECPYYAG